MVDKRKYNQLLYFCIMWFLVCFLSSLRLFGMKDFSNTPYVIIGVGSISFIIGYLIFGYKSYKKSYKIGTKTIGNKITHKSYKINYYVFEVLSISAFVFFLSVAIRALIILSLGFTYSNVRSMYQNQIPGMWVSDLELVLLNRIMIPYIYAVIPIGLYLIFRKEIKTHQVVILVLTLLFYVFGSASRAVLVYIILDILTLGFLFKVELPKKFKKTIRKVFLAGIAVVVIITALRAKNSGLSAINSLYCYMTLCVPLLDRWIDYLNAIGTKTYGMATLLGAFSSVDIFYTRIGISIPLKDVTTALIDLTEHQFIEVFAGKGYNAFVTCFYYFYMDFRMFGVSLLSFITGAIYGKYYKQINTEINLKNICIYLLLLQGLFKMMVRWEFGAAQFVLSFVFLRLMLKRVN